MRTRNFLIFVRLFPAVMLVGLVLLVVVSLPHRLAVFLLPLLVVLMFLKHPSLLFLLLLLLLQLLPLPSFHGTSLEAVGKGEIIFYVGPAGMDLPLIWSFARITMEGAAREGTHI